jgi:hypothetical protein
MHAEKCGRKESSWAYNLPRQDIKMEILDIGCDMGGRFYARPSMGEQNRVRVR